MWAFTAYEGQWHLLDKDHPPGLVVEWGWQDEICPDTKRPHKQGYIRSIQTRKSALIAALPGIFILRKYKDAKWDQLVEYCRKKESALPGTQVHVVNDEPDPNMERALVYIAKELNGWKPSRDDEKVHRLTSVKKEQIHRYWRGVRGILRRHPQWVNIFSAPNILTAWVNTHQVWEDQTKNAAVVINNGEEGSNEEKECQVCALWHKAPWCEGEHS